MTRTRKQQHDPIEHMMLAGIYCLTTVLMVCMLLIATAISEHGGNSWFQVNVNSTVTNKEAKDAAN